MIEPRGDRPTVPRAHVVPASVDDLLEVAPRADTREGAGSRGLRVPTPAKALTWFHFPRDVTRFRCAGLPCPYGRLTPS